jgi:hypothetical protein
MQLVKLVLIAAISYGAYSYWSEQRALKSQSGQGTANASPDAPSSTAGFINMPTPQGHSAQSVIVFAPPNCPEEAGVRADEMMRRLAQEGIPAVRASSANFSGENINVAQINSVMAGDLPAVFVHGTGKANPSIEDTIAQYRKLKR